jgi:glycosyltransferase involved in cell wall biosynthesis
MVEAIRLTFVIPVRHPSNSSDWDEHTLRLAQTVRSIAAQTDARWRAVIVANDGATLPPLPPQFTVERVDFPPNTVYGRPDATQEELWESIRIDKGRRVLAGLIATRPDHHVMIVDDDDFVSNRLVAFAAQQPDANGWFVGDGYIWGDGGSFVYRYPDFSGFCGTSHIVRADLYALPADAASAGDAYVKRTLGSHIFLERDLAERGTPLAPLPFYGAMYRIGHRGAVTASSGLWQHFFGRDMWFHPRAIVRRLARVRPLTSALRREFFGSEA